MPLTKPELLDRVLAAVDAGGYQTILTDSSHPFGLSIFTGDERSSTKIRVYIWNCTHGGRNRADDEFRVQLTGVVPVVSVGEQTLLLGWHEAHQVFVGFDITMHAGQASASPSIQVRENVLTEAHERSFSAYERNNGEIAIAFRSEYFVDYAKNLTALHDHNPEHGARYIEAIRNVADISNEEINQAAAAQVRSEVLQTIRRKVRQYDFRGRVLSAYDHRCAMCGVQLRLIEAAHIVPVAATGSTDETSNGVALCILHHGAFDQTLVSFNANFQIEISGTAETDLRNMGLHNGIDTFRQNLREQIFLPESPVDRPNPAYVHRGRELRRWQP